MNSNSSFALALLIVLLSGCSGERQSSFIPTGSTQKSVETLDAALRKNRLEDARRISRQALLESPSDPDRLLDAARVEAAAGNRRDGARLLFESATVAGFRPAGRVDVAVRALLEVGELYSAIDLLSQALSKFPKSGAWRRMLFGLLGEAGRTDLMQTHYQSLIRNRQFDIAVLLAMTDTSERLFPPGTIQTFIRKSGNDHRLRLGIAQSLKDERQFDKAEKVLRGIIFHHSDFAPAIAMLGRMPSVQQGSDRDFEQWLSSAEPICSKQVDYWIALGNRHYLSNRMESALSCYRSAAQLDPNRVIVWTQISHSIRGLVTSDRLSPDGKTEKLLKDCNDRSRSLLHLRAQLQQFGGSDESSQRAATNIAITLAELGRLWEAEAWSAIATTLTEDPDSRLQRVRKSITTNLKKNQTWNLVPDLDALQAYANEDVIMTPTRKRKTRAHGNASVNQSRLRLSDESSERNLVVTRPNYTDIASSLIQTLGTGGGTLDFDLDGHPDLFFSAAGHSFKDDQASNCLLRNLAGRMTSVERTAACEHSGYGQTVAVGDYNEDGFPDLFVCNVGRNRLLRNNGDGTFTDCTFSLGSDASQWTTGGAFADLNQDGVSDLIAINYCDLRSDVDAPCRTVDGPAPCHPARFPADRNEFLIGEGTGSFQRPFKDQMATVFPGRSLGILVGNLASGSQLAFIANDMSANHLFELRNPGIADIAVSQGLGVDGQSLAQASMGIAYGDFDGDQDLDLYVTGFAHEYNIYYEQHSTGVWVDSTAIEGLIDPTLDKVGFGTQAIDLDADGVDELVVTNGHIGDFGPGQPPLAQPFQLLRRSSSGRFEAVGVEDHNPYLGSGHIGRALWKVDVDGDLAQDVVVTHQNEPPVLLMNRTRTEHQRLAFAFVGTKCSRDAIGTRISFTAGGAKRSLWLLSGDGYMSNNQRVLTAGIGESSKVEDLMVTWPSGRVESFGTVYAGDQYLFIEGEGEAYALH